MQSTIERNMQQPSSGVYREEVKQEKNMKLAAEPSGPPSGRLLVWLLSWP
jgi:hypothetical protein